MEQDEKRFYEKMFSNPAYTGIGSIPQEVPDETWVDVAVIELEERGELNFWIDVQANIMNYLGFNEVDASAICQNYQHLYSKRRDKKNVLHEFLTTLRKKWSEKQGH